MRMRKRRLHSTLLAVFVFLLWGFGDLLVGGKSRTRDDWVGRRSIIYQVVTDRFAAKDPGVTCDPDCAEGGFCGGSYKELRRKLDYIAELGVTALWISPHIQNTKCGYHGFWPRNYNKVSDEFGGKRQLKKLTEEAHQKGLWVMADIVLNHMGPEKNRKHLHPFNKPEHFHPSDCHVEFTKPDTFQSCQLWDLPDLNDDNTEVRKWLIKWVKDEAKEYDFDGFRADAIPYLRDVFLDEIGKQIGSKYYIMGETFVPEVKHVAKYQKRIPGVTNFPLAFALRSAFASRQPMSVVVDAWTATKTLIDDKHAAALFINNHDVPRFMHVRNDQVAYLNALVWLMCAVHIPVLYYGDEQGASGGEPRYHGSRVPMWKHEDPYNTEHVLYRATQLLAKFRRSGMFEGEQIQRFVTPNIYAFSRGSDVLVVTSSSGSGKKYSIQIPPKSLPDAMRPPGTRVCNWLFWGDCSTVNKKGLSVTAMVGKPKVYRVVRKAGKAQRWAAPKHKGGAGKLRPAATTLRSEDDGDGEEEEGEFQQFPSLIPAGCFSRGQSSDGLDGVAAGRAVEYLAAIDPADCQGMCSRRQHCQSFAFLPDVPLGDASHPSNCILLADPEPPHPSGSEGGGRVVVHGPRDCGALTDETPAEGELEGHA
ncbi:unnamed protein product [Vitrella brassicaformis CCMP3155]|uniref:Glycosyl hydrolase family 13 catalytic domain-containing protein n=3 Tax=Vitrella brassicaformis TaxID=1169539 RepID=A0A0G4F8S7_VITBC|nr:unnamed protein product [Vitrella brassicaformis CCMP3155]|eukprot:CEM08600.1 unnamed protein product [Vitrella brassicaformis CCMP3155]